MGCDIAWLTEWWVVVDVQVSVSSYQSRLGSSAHGHRTNTLQSSATWMCHFLLSPPLLSFLLIYSKLTFPAAHWRYVQLNLPSSHRPGNWLNLTLESWVPLSTSEYSAASYSVEGVWCNSDVESEVGFPRCWRGTVPYVIFAVEPLQYWILYR